MYFESSDVGDDYKGTEFIGYLGFIFIGDGGDAEVNEIFGCDNTITNGLDLHYLGGTSPHYSVDRITGFGGLMFTCEGDFGRMVFNHTNDYNVVSSSVVIGALANGDSLNLKPYLVSEMIYRFMDYDPSVSVAEPETATLESRCYPNPVTDFTRISWQMKTAESGTVKVFDAQGRWVSTVFSGQMVSGKNEILWKPDDNRGRRVGPGVYFYRIATATATSTGKLTVF